MTFVLFHFPFFGAFTRTSLIATINYIQMSLDEKYMYTSRGLMYLNFYWNYIYLTKAKAVTENMSAVFIGTT